MLLLILLPVLLLLLAVCFLKQHACRAALQEEGCKLLFEVVWLEIQLVQLVLVERTLLHLVGILHLRILMVKLH